MSWTLLPKIFRHNQLCFFIACSQKVVLHVICLNTLETWLLNILPVLHSANVRRVCTSLASENSKSLKEVISYDPTFWKMSLVESRVDFKQLLLALHRWVTRLSRDAAPRYHWMIYLRVESRQVCKACRRALSAVNLGRALTTRYDADA